MESWGSEHFIYVLLAGIVTILKAFWTTFSSVLRALNRVAAEAGLFIASRVGEFIVTIICIVAHQTIGTLLILLVLVNGFALASTFYYVSQRFLRPQLQVSIAQLRHIFREGMPYALTTIFTAIYFNFDTVLVSKLVSDRSAGLYRAVYNLILPMMMVTASVTGAVFPFVSQNIRQFPQRAYELIRRSSRYLLLMGLPLAVFGCIESKNVVLFLFAPEYAESALSLSILVWFLPIVYITNLYGNLLGAMDQQWFVLRITTVNVIFNIIANIILIPTFAQNGASVVTVLTELLGLLFLSTRMRRQVPSLVHTSFFVRTCLAMIPSAGILFLFPRLYLPLLIFIAGAVYIVSIIVVKALPVEELKNLRNNLRGSYATD
jgi:O-antigen/teichoic acid export membrane protein